MHIPVLLQETLDGLVLQTGDRVFEGTVGLGGHSEEICKKIGAEGVYVGTDEDENALARAEERLAPYSCKKIFKLENFRNLDRVLDEEGMPFVDKMLFDIGLSNLQLEEPGRGFSFKRDEPLRMTFRVTPREDDLTAREIVNEWGADTLTDIFTGYGEERFAWRIAQAIVSARTAKPIETTGELAEIVKNAVPVFARFGKIHPATKVFQAIRIAVNDELGALRDGITKGFARLAPGGRMAIISFHSLEDRMVKNFFRTYADEGKGTLVVKRPITPSDEELERNPKSRSAKLRIIEKLSTTTP
ncbi:MAG: 16S rRNA (cytosine(1402)-N(4))-methyltransferase [Candidatus Yonathbacteria bacterium RIFCSPLOWO2_01_FULL_43_27]|uniref:Ribosomal RNA small subunit methyltransferase H n=1 Tax=Candidatus Yonathbacteria bacterium RIFCSPLOWO2_01_FULL_43_27 TaxID=1802726 RepID=A0A1G2SDR3_9BACT|nr:MAG: 16S rRNA (cytosine(1402)-N(4))-methyltransferase [Candidatus Yonathbacteria bacterium RIFCSPHIGHO2_01_FULL_44_19]OHA82591.1 MAG: 16S rRNA (cytosine(1402)-N(4))-methyltransferase [Candidatus Yonathbacteria bacterium RIFCSPLOWO2_01_FULL_43_27]